jgi:cellulose synthase/poly-beta-1,6-N-acetylglucosamine synthase-like glycosyltransferase
MGAYWLAAYLVVACLAVVQALLIGLQTWEHRRFARGRLEFLRKRRPGGRVALFVPCKGVDLELEESLHTLLRQDYGNYEVTFIVESPDDPAYAMVRRVTDAHPQADWGVIIAGEASSSGQKVHNLLAATENLPPDVEYLAFVDSDARPNHYWLRALVSELVRKEVGAVTGYRWFVPRQPSLANHLLYSINCNYASLVGKDSPLCVWGGSWAIRREAFEQLGVREAWKGTLSDDLVVSRVIRRAGLRIEFEPACMVASPLDNTMGETLSFIRRQYVIAKHYLPFGWLSALLLVSFANLVLFGSMVAVGWTLASGLLSPWIPAGILAVLYLASVYRGLVRHDLAAIYFPDQRDRLRKARRFDVWAGPFVGLVNWLALAISVVGRRITWRGITYRIRGGGQTRLLRRDDAALADETRPEQELTAPVTHPYPEYRKAG